MCDEEASPRPFRRERNLSNRNFNKQGSNRKHQKLHNITYSEEKTKTEIFTNMKERSSPSVNTPSAEISNFISSEAENTSDKKSLSDSDNNADNDNGRSAQIKNGCIENSLCEIPTTSDPALLDVKQKLLLFENLQCDEGIIFKTSRNKSKSSQSQSLLLTAKRSNSTSSMTSPASASGSYVVKMYPPTDGEPELEVQRKAEFHGSINEECSHDEVKSISDEIDASDVAINTEGAREDFGKSSSLEGSQIQPVAAINKSFLTIIFPHSTIHPEENNKPRDDQGPTAAAEKRSNDFPRNYRSRPKTEVIQHSYQPLSREYDNFDLLRVKSERSETDDEEQIELRDKSFSCIQPILHELIKTEESYVENLWIGINNYSKIFQRSDLPIGLRGKKYVLFGNIEQIAEFHRDEFLPMLHRNQHDLKRIFDEFKQFIDRNCFYGYVLFTMNKQRSLKLCDVYKNYFKLLQNEIDDKLGINSFLVQPIQRMARYPLLLQQFITALFKNRDYVMKPVIESCCRLEKKFRNLLVTTNESEIINDIVCMSDTHEFNTFYQGKFRKVSEFQVFDHTLKRSYRSKVFMFDKCIIYTEIKGKQLIFHGRYPCEHIGITSKTKQFTLYYDQRKQQECDFMSDQSLIDQWLDLIREMVSAFAVEERRKLKELHSHEFRGGDYMYRKPANLSLFRDSNRFSSDSGIGNIWVLPKPEQEEATSNRTTWYAVS